MSCSNRIFKLVDCAESVNPIYGLVKYKGVDVYIESNGNYFWDSQCKFTDEELKELDKLVKIAKE